MMHEFSSAVRALGTSLQTQDGGYLRNTIHEPKLTCEICSAPIQPEFRICMQCNRHRKSSRPLADRAGSLIYAVKGSQSYRTVQSYKGAHPAPGLTRVMNSLLALGLQGHMRCLTKVATKVDAWAVVPSTRGRSTIHNMVNALAKHSNHEIPIELTAEARARELRPMSWSVRLPNPTPRHVLVIDDSWVTGSKAQSVAAALKDGGVHEVSIFTVARVLDPSWGPNPAFITGRLAREAFRWQHCP